MSFLLGSEYCIQSLSNDVSDVQSCIKDIIFKIGRINSISWKFPDKFACDLNIDEYLTSYKYDANDNENNQISHIILLELIIDRVCLLLQLHCETIDKIILKDNRSNTNNCKSDLKIKMMSPCLGLTSKKHWNKLCQLSVFVDNIQQEFLELFLQDVVDSFASDVIDYLDELHGKKILIGQTKKANKNLNLTLEKLKANTSNQNPADEVGVNDNLSKQAGDWLRTLENESKISIKHRKPAIGSISKDMTFKSSQTIETAFKPCESCHISQTCLRESSSLLMKILKEESQPSSLMKLQQEILNLDWLSDKKILQIKDCFAKDLDKIYTIYRNIRQKEMKTTEDLLDCRNICKNLTDALEKEKCVLSTAEKKFNQQRHEFGVENEKLSNTISQFQLQTASLMDEIKEKGNQINHEKAQLKQQILEKQNLNKELDKLKVSISNFNVNATDPIEALEIIKRKISDLTDNVSQLNSTIQNQKSINENLTVTENVIKDKEDKLIKRLQNLTEQKRKLEEKIDILQDQLESNQESLRALENERISMSMKLSNQTVLIETITKAKDEFSLRISELQSQLDCLQQTIIEIKQEKNLLVNYPDLNGPLEKIESGNIEQDLINQIKSNVVRISLLSDQNLNLEHALEKLNQTSSTNKDIISSNFINSTNNFINTSGLPPTVVSLELSRPNSKMSHVGQSMPKKLTHRQSASGRPRSRENNSAQGSIIQWSVSNQKPSNVNAIFVCETCGRSYQQKSDLEVHKEYCAGRRRRSEQK